MLATTASTALSILTSQPSVSSTLQQNVLLFRQILSKLEPLPLSSTTDGLPPLSSSASISSIPPPPIPNKDAIIHIPSHPNSALIHIFLLTPPPTMEAEEKLLQEVVDETLGKTDVLITRARRLRGQETFEPEPSLKICISGALSRKEVEKAAKGLRETLVKVCGSESLRHWKMMADERSEKR
jgi:serine palmitoyltransferase